MMKRVEERKRGREKERMCVREKGNRKREREKGEKAKRASSST